MDHADQELSYQRDCSIRANPSNPFNPRSIVPDALTADDADSAGLRGYYASPAKEPGMVTSVTQ